MHRHLPAALLPVVLLLFLPPDVKGESTSRVGSIEWMSPTWLLMWCKEFNCRVGIGPIVMRGGCMD